MPPKTARQRGWIAGPLLKGLFVLGLIGVGCWPPNPLWRGDQLPPAAERPPEPEPPVRFPKPEHVRGIYLTAWSAGSKSRMDQVLGLLERTELNAVVIDVRDQGYVYWKTGIALADEAGATRVAVPRPEELMARLEEYGIYPIARISCFQDAFVPKKRPERAIQTEKGTPWKERNGSTWLDPYNRENWEYIGQVVDFALDMGFPEIQLDYVRFPSEGRISSAVFPARADYPESDAEKTEVIAAFAQFIKERMAGRNAVLSADLFGIISISDSDQGIGQQLETIAEPFDLICPMVYPSLYARGEYGFRNPATVPYEIVKRSLARFIERVPEKPIRPWIQDFSLRVKYGVDEVEAQIKAAKELGIEEYLLWNPRNRYTEEAVVDTSGLVEPEDTGDGDPGEQPPDIGP
ncbi:MAG: putative glycoside hydrolase [Armatimonadetes bacterium]|nr:putative glycoside hydrolase [Armatimonadota bacterium]